MNVLAEAPLVAACVLTLASAWTDARTGRIPHRLTMSMLSIGLVLALVGGGLVGLGYALFGVLLCASVPLVLFYATRGAAIGGGDVGLFGALGALLGPTAGLQVELASMVLLAAFAL